MNNACAVALTVACVDLAHIGNSDRQELDIALAL